MLLYRSLDATSLNTCRPGDEELIGRIALLRPTGDEYCDGNVTVTASRSPFPVSLVTATDTPQLSGFLLLPSFAFLFSLCTFGSANLSNFLKTEFLLDFFAVFDLDVVDFGAGRGALAAPPFPLILAAALVDLATRAACPEPAVPLLLLLFITEEERDRVTVNLAPVEVLGACVLL